MSSMDNPQPNLSHKGLKQDKQPNEHAKKSQSSGAPRTCAADKNRIIPHYNQPAGHPNFDPQRIPLDPDRPLSDVPSPVRRQSKKLERIYTLPETSTDNTGTDYKSPKSAWDLLASPSFSSHIDLLRVAGLIELPDSFFECPNNVDDYPLLSSLAGLTLLDMADVYHIVQSIKDDGMYLTRYGLIDSPQPRDDSQQMPEMINDGYAPDWELILYPEHFDNGVDSITTDILACSVAVYVLSQCDTRKTINHKLSAQQICHHMRSYVLSQCHLYPHKSTRYRQVRLFEGHIIVAAKYLGLKISTSTDANKFDFNEAKKHKVEKHKVDKNRASNTQQFDTLDVYFNLSSRSSLFVRYPNISSFYINGWK